MGDHPEEIIGFQFVRKGVELVRESRREIALTAGDVVLWDGLQPTQVEVVEPFVKRTLIFPRERVLAVCPRLADLKALPPMDHNGAAALLVRYLNALAAELPGLDATARGAAADAALELLRAAVEPAVPTSRDARRAAMRAEVRRYVRAHLRDPELDPEAIARAHAISVRALHALFEDTGESVAEPGPARAARALLRGPRPPERRLGDRDRVPLGLPRRRALLARVQARVRGHAERGPPRRARGPRRRRGRTDRQRIRRCHTSPRPDAALASPRDGGSDGGQGGPRHGRGERHRPRLRDPLRPGGRGGRRRRPRARAGRRRGDRARDRGRRAGAPRSSPCDVVARPRTARRSSRDVVERYGRLDYAHNNAGIGVHAPLADDRRRGLRPRHRRQPARHVPRHEAPDPPDAADGGGAIVNTSSNAGLRGGAAAQRLHREQARHQRPDEERGGRVRQRRHPRELRLPRGDHDAAHVQRVARAPGARSSARRR